MCSPPMPATNDIGVSAEEEIFTTLEKIENGSPLPGNIIPHDPCQYNPSDLRGLQNMVGEESLASYLSEPVGEEIIRNGQGTGSRSHDYNRDDENNLALVAGGLSNHPADYTPEIDGDYIELLDLDDPASSSSSSENSSCVSWNSDDCFDSSEFLRDLETEVNSDEQKKSADGKFNMHPESAGFLANGNRDNTPAQPLKISNVPPGSPTEQNSHGGTAGRKIENDNGGSSSNPRHGDSSSGGPRATIVKREASSKKTKILKYLCCRLD